MARKIRKEFSLAKLFKRLAIDPKVIKYPLGRKVRSKVKNATLRRSKKESKGTGNMLMESIN